MFRERGREREGGRERGRVCLERERGAGIFVVCPQRPLADAVCVH